jgi:hypothetical protein
MMLHQFNLVRIWEDIGVNSAMKKALALSAFALILTLPLVSSAGTVSSTFLSSTSGTSTILVGDTISFEISITTITGANYGAWTMSVGGDQGNALSVPNTSGPTWAGVDQQVVAFEWNYKSGGSNKVKFATNSTIAPNVQTNPLGFGVLSNNGWNSQNVTGNGNINVIGTVTILANTAGSYSGGGFEIPGLDAFFGTAGSEVYFSNTAAYVVPEPGTAVLMVLGLGGLGLMGRKSRK